MCVNNIIILLDKSLEADNLLKRVIVFILLYYHFPVLDNPRIFLFFFTIYLSCVVYFSTYWLMYYCYIFIQLETNA